MTSATALNVNTPSEPDEKPVATPRQPRKLSSVPATPATPAEPKLLTPQQIAKLPLKQQAAAYVAHAKAMKAKADAAIEAAKAERGPRGDGGGTAKLQLLVLKNPGLRGDKLVAAVRKAGILGRNGEPLKRATIDLGPQDMAHRLRTADQCSMLNAAGKAWLKAHDAAPRNGK